MRYIGIWHRIKKTTRGEARPTQLVIIDGEEVRTLELEKEIDELDFVLGRYPVKYRKAEPDEDITKYQRYQLKTHKPKKSEDLSDTPRNLLVKMTGEKTPYVVTQVPCEFDGLKAGDKIAMILGGSGDRLASALSRRGDEIGASVLRMAMRQFKVERGNGNKDKDAELLARLVQVKPELFYETGKRDRALIQVRESTFALIDAMKERIACEDRLRSRLIGRVFCKSDGLYPEGGIEDQFDREKASDKILKVLKMEEGQRQRDLKKALGELNIFTELFDPIQGCGPRIAGRLISAVIDIRRFEVKPDQGLMDRLYEESAKLELEGRFQEDLDKIADRITDETNNFQKLQMVRSWKERNGKKDEADLLTQAILKHQQRHKLRRQALQKGAAKFKMFCGVAVAGDGGFLRWHHGEVANWNAAARQALYFIGDQFNRRPKTVWGQVLIHYKAEFRKKHAEEVNEVTNKKRYTNAHIHKMGLWRTITKFVEWLYRNWVRLEHGGRVIQRVPPAAPNLSAGEMPEPAESAVA